MIRRALLALSIVIFAAPFAARACTCSKAPPGTCPGLQEGDVVFLGTVTEVESIPASAPEGDSMAAASSGATAVFRYHFRIDERFAGPDAPEIDVFSGGDDGDCAFRFQKGEQYIVFPDKADDGRLFASICSGTRLGLRPGTPAASMSKPSRKRARAALCF